MSVSLTLEQFQALSSLAKANATPDKVRAVDSFVKSIEKANNIVRYTLWIQWQEAGAPVPPTSNFPTVWPPELRVQIERLDRPISKEDVEQILMSHSSKPVAIMVTPDPGALLGWTLIEDFFPA